jgi:hypothetical protein
MTEFARNLLRTISRAVLDMLSFASSVVRSRAHLSAENLFLRKQLALYLERQAKARRADDATCITLVALSRFLEWRELPTVVKPETLIRWHRKGFRLFWRWKSRAPGRPPIPADVQRLIRTMAVANRTWGEDRIAAGTPREARDSSLGAYGATVHAVMPTTPPSRHTGVEYVRTEPRAIRARH